jgi:hypothetical protein
MGNALAEPLNWELNAKSLWHCGLTAILSALTIEALTSVKNSD